MSTVAKNVPLGLSQGFAKDYADPSTFMNMFESTSISPTGNLNGSLVGLTPAMAKQLGITIPTGDVIPSIDAQAAACDALPVGNARTTCYVNLDKYLMTDVVPWVPYLFPTAVHLVSSAVTAWDFDQSSDTTAFSHVAVDPAKQS